MNEKLDQEQLEIVEQKLGEFEGTATWNRRELETAMEALASQIFLLIKKGEEPDSLADAVRLLPIDRKAKRQLTEICEEFQQAMDKADYDRGDDEDEADAIMELKSDFFYILEEQLKKLRE